MNENLYVGIDLGGTSTKLAFVSEEGNIVHKWSIPTDTSNNGEQIITHIAQSIDEQLVKTNNKKESLRGLGMGAPGFIDLETGFVYQAVNIGWRDYPLKDKLEEVLGIPAVIDNDANVAALGEMWRGAGDGSKQLLCVTLGTGVGGGIIINGNIVHGINGMAGEIGHITVQTSGGAPCNCGKSGCLESFASATGIVRLAEEAVKEHPDSQLNELDKITAKAVFELAEKGDQVSNSVIEQMTHVLGLVLANLSNAINPEKIVIGGGVSMAGEPLLKLLRKQFKAFALPRVNEGVDFEIATLGNDAGVIGSAWLAKEKV
ncbi:ROK family glucokinase [Bacillus solimangrovi]|uniref:Glucokinase n=1 Tax=Bacillus solimangrovi TaxID=1305675 RepID=A0A1E5LFN7_9BACI|nr:ROK family glucokinase [Bacillus solimangrovi]OEH92897.1 glucokinase [Bacillus solimangrovi]